MPNTALIAFAPAIMAADLPPPEHSRQAMMTPIEVTSVEADLIDAALLETRLVETGFVDTDMRSTLLSSVGVMRVEWDLAQIAAPQDTPQDQSTKSPGEEPDPTAQGQEEPVIVVSGDYGPQEGDPVEEFNAESYRITQELDEVFVEPVAYAYRDGLPGPLRDGLGNVVRNLGEPNNALNFLLQGKIGKSFETLGRLLINSTLGLGGLIDIAKKPGIGLPYRRNGFANTMGFYGVGPGPYLYLPVTGATTARDLVGSGLDQLLLPVAVGEPFNRLEYSVPFYVINNLDARLEVDAELQRIDDTIDPYAARRDSYLYRRAKTIAELKGEEPPPPPAIMEEVEGTGDFAPVPAGDEQITPDTSTGGVDAAGDGTVTEKAASAPLERPVLAVTRPR